MPCGGPPTAALLHGEKWWSDQRQMDARTIRDLEAVIEALRANRDHLAEEARRLATTLEEATAAFGRMIDERDAEVARLRRELAEAGRAPDEPTKGPS